MKCSRCGGAITEDNCYKRGERLICPDCYSSLYYICGICGKEKLRSYSHNIKTSTGTIKVCRTCYEDPSKVFRCHFCKSSHLVGEENTNEEVREVINHEYGGEARVCTECANKKFARCHKCHKLDIVDRLITHPSNKNLYHKQCLPSTVKICALCGSPFSKGKGVKVITYPHGGTTEKIVEVCPKCGKDRVIKCSDCGRLILTYYSSLKKIKDKYLCNTCYYKRVVTCPDCDREYLREDMVNFVLGKESKLICNNCRYHKVIMDYHYRPSPNFLRIKGEEDFAAHFGLEIEVTSKEIEAGELAQMFSNQFFDYLNDNFYIKFDRSIGNGFEIVTHPMSLGYFRRSFPLKDMLKWLKPYVYMDGNGLCGIHIHIDKDQYPELSPNNKNISEKELENKKYDNDIFLQKLLIFFHVEFDKIITFSERHDKEKVDRFCYKLNKKFTDNMMKGNGNPHSDPNMKRHGCLNLETHRSTIEIRVFNGTIEYPKVSRFVKFTSYLIDFIKTYPKWMFLNLYTNAHLSKGVQMTGKEKEEYLWNKFVYFIKSRDYVLYKILSEIK